MDTGSGGRTGELVIVTLAAGLAPAPTGCEDRGLLSTGPVPSRWCASVTTPAETTSPDLFNVHPDDRLAALADAFTGNGPAVVVLNGPDRVGRADAVATAARRVTRDGTALRVLPLDLQGFEPGMVELSGFVRHQVGRRGHDEDTRARLEKALLELVPTAPPNLGSAVLLSLLAGLEQPLDGRSEWQGELALQGPDLPERTVVEQLLAWLGRRERVVVHAVDGVSCSLVTRRWLVRLAQAVEGLTVVISAEADGTPGEYAPGADAPLALSIERLDDATLTALLARNFGDDAVPAGVRKALLETTRGWPPFVASRLAALVEAGCLTESDGRWSVADEAAAKEVLERDALAPVRDVLAKLEGALPGMLQEYLSAACLLGDVVPSDLIIESMRLTRDQRDELVDAIDDHLIDDPSVGLLVDHEYGHPAVPGLSVYAFDDMVLAQAIVEEIPAAERAERAAKLLEGVSQRVPMMNRGLARLYVSLTAHLPTPEERLASRRAMAWWVGPDESVEFKDALVEQLAAGAIDPEELWAALTSRPLPWPAWRRLALCDAYAEQPEGVPGERESDVPFVRAHLLVELQQLEQARDEVTRSWELRKERNGETSQEATGARSLLGVILREMKELDAAKEHLQAVLEVAADAWGSEDPQMAAAHHNLGTVLRLQEQLPAAKEHFERATAIDATNDGAPSARSAASLHDLGLIESQLGENEAAKDHLEQSLAFMQQLYGPRHQRTGTVHATLSRVLNVLGDKAGAKGHVEAALVIQEAMTGANSLQVAASLSMLAGLQLETDDVDGARSSLERALAIQEAAQGRETPGVANILANLGWVLQRQGQGAQAEALCKEALAILEKVRGPNHPEVATALNNMAGMLESKGDLDGAMEKLRRSLGILEVGLGPRHPRLAMALVNLAQILRKKDRPKEAKTRLQRAKTICDANNLPADEPLVQTIDKVLAEID